MSSRDLITELPVWPSPLRTSFGKGQVGAAAFAHERGARLRCNKAILTLQELSRGNFTDKILVEEPWGKVGPLSSTRGQALRVCERLLDIHRKDAEPLDLPAGVAALERLLGLSDGAVAGDSSACWSPPTSLELAQFCGAQD